MPEIPATARVVIIGGGAVGASALYHLALAGWTDCVLLEKNELTAGSTWHAAGNVPTFSSSWSIMNMQRYSAELYRGLGAAVDYPMNYHVTGSVRLGHSAERMQEFRRVVGMGRYQGMDLDVLGPNEIRDRYPFVETHELTGALYDPYDGDIDPAQLTQALAKGARDLGCKIIRFCPVTGVRRDGGEWVVSTPKGEIRCEYVVNAAGYYAREVGRWFGRDVPMMVMSHQYLLFDTIPDLEHWSRGAGHKLPLEGTVLFSVAGDRIELLAEPVPPPRVEDVAHGAEELNLPDGRVAVTQVVAGGVVGLPPIADDTLLIVSRMVAAGASDRSDLVFPYELVRDDDGRVIGAASLGVFTDDQNPAGDSDGGGTARFEKSQ